MKRHQVIGDGAVAGLLGAVTVALWFLLFDISRGVPLETPTLLAAALLHGKTVVSGVQLQYVVEYTVLHFAAFLLPFGVAACRDPDRNCGARALANHFAADFSLRVRKCCSWR